MDLYGKIINDNVVEFDNLPNQYNGVENVILGYRLRTDLHKKDGFFLISKSSLKEGERYLPVVPSDLNIEKEVFEQRIELIPQPTTEELIQKAIDDETQKYIQRQQDGVMLYAQISAKFRLAKMQGQIDEASHNAIENILRPVRDEVLAGQWKTALKLLEGIGTVVIGVELYNELHTEISNYITENYKL